MTSPLKMPDEGHRSTGDTPQGLVLPPCASIVPRFAGIATFARLPRLDQVEKFDVGIVGIPFDAGCSYRTGARFGPAAVREASRLLRPYDPALNVRPWCLQQVVDAGDIPVNPFSISEAISQIEVGSKQLLAQGGKLIAIGGDHTIALPLLRATCQKFGPVALIHFDAHLDTWDTYFGQPFTHGTPFRRAAEEGLFLDDCSIHIGVRGPVYASEDFDEDKEMGFRIIHCREMDELGIGGAVDRIKARVGDAPVYISVDVDVLDPSAAPGTGTPEPGGLSTRELLGMLRGLRGLHVVGGDVVEVAPSYDHAQVTSLAAASVCYTIMSLLAICKDKALPAGGGSTPTAATANTTTATTTTVTATAAEASAKTESEKAAAAMPQAVLDDLVPPEKLLELFGPNYKQKLAQLALEKDE